MKTLTRKGYARIYVANNEDIEKVKEVIKELDEFEYDYMPSGIVAHFSKFPELVYTHKFDGLCMNKLMAVCWSRGIHAWVFDNGRHEFSSPEGEAFDL